MKRTGETEISELMVVLGAVLSAGAVVGRGGFGVVGRGGLGVIVTFGTYSLALFSGLVGCQSPYV